MTGLKSRKSRSYFRDTWKTEQSPFITSTGTGYRPLPNVPAIIYTPKAMFTIQNRGCRKSGLDQFQTSIGFALQLTNLDIS